MNVNIDTILGSAVISTAISAIVAYATSKKQNDLQYITSERKEWREGIRKLVERLNGAGYKKTLQILAELKVRINAFGNGETERYDKDSHIWELMNEIEEKELPKESLVLKQKQLIEYLSLLLKSDWERCKREVKGDVLRLVSVFFMGGAFLYYALNAFDYAQNKEKVWEWTACMIMIFLFIVLLNGGTAYFEKDILNGMIHSKMKSIKTKKILSCYAIWAILALVNIWLFAGIAMSPLDGFVHGVKEKNCAGVSVFIYVFGLVAFMWSEMSRMGEYFSYTTSIDRVMDKYKKAEDWGENL